MMAALFSSFRTLAVSFSALIVYAMDSDELCRGRIHSVLQARSVTDVDIRNDWLLAERRTFRYDVAYTDAQGHRATNRCSIAIRPLEDDAIVWERPLDA